MQPKEEFQYAEITDNDRSLLTRAKQACDALLGVKGSAQREIDLHGIDRIVPSSCRADCSLL